MNSARREGTSLQKQPVNIKQKVISIDKAVNELHQNIQFDQYKTEKIQKINSHHNEKLRNQIFALKQAFEKLGDGVLEETEKIRKEVFEELRESTNSSFIKFGKLQKQIQKSEDERTKTTLQVQDSMKEIKQNIKQLYEKYSQIQKNIESLQEEESKHQDLSKIKLEEIQKELEVQEEKIGSLTQKSLVIQEKMEQVTKQNSDLGSFAQNCSQKLSEVEVTYNYKSGNSGTRLSEIEKWNVNINKEHLQLQETFSQVKDEIQIQLESFKIEYQHILQDLEERTRLKQSQAAIQSQSTLGEIATEIQDDIKQLASKIDRMEDIQEMSKKEIQQNMRVIQQTVGSHLQVLQKQYYSICRDNNFTPYSTF